MNKVIQGKGSEGNFDNLNIGYILDELAQLKMDFVNYHMEIKSMKIQGSSDKKFQQTCP